MAKLKPVLRGLSMIFALLLAIAIVAGQVMENYWSQLDNMLGTTSYETIVDKDGDTEWTFESQFKTAKEAVEGLKEFAIRESVETYALLKNEGSALPISKTAKITLLGLRSYEPVYGNSAGSVAGKTEIEAGNTIIDAFKGRGFQLNPSMLETYSKYFEDLTLQNGGFGATPHEYKEITVTDRVAELSPSELEQINDKYKKDFEEYNDAAILVFGRPGGENKEYRPGADGLKEGATNTGNVLGLSTEELALVKLAKDNFKKVIVLINSTNQMDIADIAAQKTADNYGVDAIMWIGYPGSYGFWGVADVLNGTVSPSAHLGDTYAKNNALAPAMMNFGSQTQWTNKPAGDNINSILIMAEGIYTGYRYYETRYADIVNGVNGASNAKAGTYAAADGKPASSDGTWSYSNEVVYPFGHGLSYTTFKQELKSVSISADKKTATVSVLVTNTGSVPGKSVVEVYGQAPYTAYDKQNGVEKSAIQLLDYEKTRTLEPKESETVTLYVDMANIASYDIKARNGKGGFIVEEGDYYIAIGDDAHDALNNILAAQDKNTSHGMTAAGDKSKTHTWKWGYDAETFSVAYTGADITNHLTEGMYAMDYNYFMPGTVTYLTRSDWNGTFPKTYENQDAQANSEIAKALGNSWYEFKNDAQEGEFKWGVDSGLSIYDPEFRFIDWDDPLLDKLVDQVTIEEFLAYLSTGLHTLPALPGLGVDSKLETDDGPGGADEHYIDEDGTYHGEAYADRDNYKGYGTRVAPGQINLAYSWNKELAYENGSIILGESTLMFNLPIMIGPGGNIHRHAYNGRGGEYYSEDPILSGYTGSATIQGAQDKGCLVNIKHLAFNDQEINRSGVATFTSEQTARELELRNLEQMITAKGKPAAWVRDMAYENYYTQGALGIMTSYNRIGAVASSANKGVMIDILRNEWGFKGFNQTDFTGISAKAAPRESVLFGTTGFCGFGGNISAFITKEQVLADREMSAAIKRDIKNVAYAYAHTMFINAPIHLEWRMTSWRQGYYAGIGISAGLLVLSLGGYIALTIIKRKEEN